MVFVYYFTWPENVIRPYDLHAARLCVREFIMSPPNGGSPLKRALKIAQCAEGKVSC